jgi:hypothetical protein
MLSIQFELPRFRDQTDFLLSHLKRQRGLPHVFAVALSSK